MTRIYAVGLKDWVELRESTSAPVPKVTSTSKVITDTKRVPIYNGDFNFTGKYNLTEVKSRVRFKNCIFVGGKVVAQLKRRAFCERTGITLREGDVREVPPDIAGPIIADDWSKKVPQEFK